MEMCIARMHSSNKLYGSGFMMLSANLYAIFIKYIQQGRIRAPPAKDLIELAPTFQSGAKTDRRALQSKFKSWAKRMTLIDDHLVMANTGKFILPREQCESVIRKIHFQNENDHLSFEEVMVEIQKTYTWNRKNFGMDWNIVASTLAVICTNENCLTGLQRQYYADSSMRNLSSFQSDRSVSESNVYSPYMVSQVNEFSNQVSPLPQRYMIKFPANYRKSGVITKLLTPGDRTNTEKSLKSSLKESPKSKFLKNLSLVRCIDKKGKKRKHSNFSDESIIPHYFFTSPDSGIGNYSGIGFNDIRNFNSSHSFTSSPLFLKSNESDMKLHLTPTNDTPKFGEEIKSFTDSVKYMEHLSRYNTFGAKNVPEISNILLKTQYSTNKNTSVQGIWNTSLNVWKTSVMQNTENNSQMPIPWDKLPSKTYLKDDKFEKLPSYNNSNSIGSSMFFYKISDTEIAGEQKDACFNWVPGNQYAKILNPTVHSTNFSKLIKIDTPHPASKAATRIPTTLWRPDPESMDASGAGNNNRIENKMPSTVKLNEEIKTLEVTSFDKNTFHTSKRSANECHSIKKSKYFWEVSTLPCNEEVFYSRNASQTISENRGNIICGKNNEDTINTSIEERKLMKEKEDDDLFEGNLHHKLADIWTLCSEMNFDFRQFLLSIIVDDGDFSLLQSLNKKIDEALSMVRQISEFTRIIENKIKEQPRDEAII